MTRLSFDEYTRRMTEKALSADMAGYRTVATVEREISARDLVPLGNTWTEALFDGPFYRTPANGDGTLPAVNLVFVQSADLNTGARNPSTLGGGETDKHLIYEGLSRIDADGVLSGAGTIRDAHLVLSVWHPELVALRTSRGRGRHPAQIIVSNTGDLRFDEALMFQVPEVPVFVITTSAVAESIRRRVVERPWIEPIDAGSRISLADALGQLRSRGIEVISAIGGRYTATALLREKLVSDIYLTTSPVKGGEPDTPYYTGPALPLRAVVEKAGLGHEAGVRFEHFVV